MMSEGRLASLSPPPGGKSSRRREKPTRQSVVHGYGRLNTALRWKRTRTLHRVKRLRLMRWKPETRALRRDVDAGVVLFRTSARRASHSDTPGPSALPGEGQPEGWGNTDHGTEVTTPIRVHPGVRTITNLR